MIYCVWQRTNQCHGNRFHSFAVSEDPVKRLGSVLRHLDGLFQQSTPQLEPRWGVGVGWWRWGWGHTWWWMHDLRNCLQSCISHLPYFPTGVTWVFGLLAIQEASNVFAIPFCVFNSIQGFLIFAFYCLRSPNVRNAWRSLCCPSERKKKATPQGLPEGSSRTSLSNMHSTLSNMHSSGSELISLRGWWMV